VLNNLVGASSHAFLAAMARLGRGDPAFGPGRCPILSCNLTECELPTLGDAAEGLVSAGPYFRDGAGAGSSFEAAAHAAVRFLAERLARQPEAPLERLLTMPGGGLAIDPATHHATLPVLIAQVEGGAFRVRERWDAVLPDPYLARRDRFVLPRPQLAVVAP
jgi:branched-chain amino acid transport system substrate-binding protein